MADIAMDAVRYEESINKEIEKITNLDNSIPDKTDGLHNVDSKEKNIASQNRCEIELSKMAGLRSLARGEVHPKECIRKYAADEKILPENMYQVSSDWQIRRVEKGLIFPTICMQKKCMTGW